MEYGGSPAAATASANVAVAAEACGVVGGGVGTGVRPADEVGGGVGTAEGVGTRREPGVTRRGVREPERGRELKRARDPTLDPEGRGSLGRGGMLVERGVKTFARGVEGGGVAVDVASR